MTDHVSVETARKLRDAGLARGFAVGDWVSMAIASWMRCLPGVSFVVLGDYGRVLSVLGSDRSGPWDVEAADALWLPTAGQLLALAQERGGVVDLSGSASRGWWANVCTPNEWVDSVLDYAAEPAEALAMALLDWLKWDKEATV